jgi:hypothetical protein
VDRMRGKILEEIYHLALAKFKHFGISNYVDEEIELRECLLLICSESLVLPFDLTI